MCSYIGRAGSPGAGTPGPGAGYPVLIVFLVLGPGTRVLGMYTFVRGRAGFPRAGYLGIFFQVLRHDTRVFYPPLGPDGTSFRIRVSGHGEPDLHTGISDFSVHLPLQPHTTLREKLTRMGMGVSNNLQNLIQSIVFGGKKYEYNSILKILY